VAERLTADLGELSAGDYPTELSFTTFVLHLDSLAGHDRARAEL
jgi:type IV secretory pathway TrbF-like protein